MKLIFDNLKFEFNFLLENAPLMLKLVAIVRKVDIVTVRVMIVTCILQYNVKSTLFVMNVVKKLKILTESNK